MKILLLLVLRLVLAGLTLVSDGFCVLVALLLLLSPLNIAFFNFDRSSSDAALRGPLLGLGALQSIIDLRIRSEFLNFAHHQWVGIRKVKENMNINEIAMTKAYIDTVRLLLGVRG